MIYRLFTCSFMAVLVAVVAGCSKPVEYFEEMKMMPTKEKLLEFPLGHFDVPIPVQPSSETTEWTHGNTVHIGFKLYAVIHPSDEKAIVKSWSHHEWNFRDDVLQICRSATLSELIEPGLSTLKGRLTEAAGRRLGGGRIRRLVMSEVNVLPL